MTKCKKKVGKGRGNVTRKEKRANFVRKYASLFRCPICHSPVKVIDLKSLVCIKNHTFDFAKQGYVNLLTRPVTSQYDKQLFQARKRIITETDLYTPLHNQIADVIEEYARMTNEEIIVFDAGCGEGSHLQRILATCNRRQMTGIGIDLAKEAIRMAAREYENSIWFVADLANPPLINQSCHVVFNIFSPANYEEFKRILVSEGLLIKVVPRSDYFRELRDELSDHLGKQSYRNDKTVSLFKQHFHVVKWSSLRYTKKLKESDLIDVVKMSPLAWNVEEEVIERVLLEKRLSEMTIDVDLLIGMKPIEK